MIMSFRSAFAIFALALGSIPGRAYAQSSFELQIFRPSAHGDSFFTVESGAIQPSLDVRASLWLNYAYRPLLLLDESGKRVSSLDHRFDLNIMGAITLFDRLSLALAIPATLYQGGTLPTGSSAALAAVAFGDIRFEPKLGILEQKRHFIDLAILLGLTVPTGNKRSFAGDINVTAYGELDLSRRFGAFRAGINFGFLWRQTTTYYDLRVGPELYGRLGLGLDIGYLAKKVPIEFIFEIYGRTSATRPFVSEGQNPVEAVLGLRYQPVRWFALSAGGGRGILAGYGAPGARGFLAATFIPLAKQESAPPHEPATVPASIPASVPVDSDGDGILDADDRCAHEAEDKDNWQDVDGCPDPDNDADGIRDTADQCPNDPEDNDGFQDEDGCPDSDNDGDGIKDAEDKCPSEAETVNGVDDFDGCPDQGASLVIVTKEGITILEKVQFQAGKDKILPSSFGLLNQVAATLKNHSEIKLMQVEGHTDSVGADNKNLKLSQRRAASVRAYLIKKGGVEGGRVVAIGFGETKPIAPNASRKGREANRRVAFTILEADSGVQSMGASLPTLEPIWAP